MTDVDTPMTGAAPRAVAADEASAPGVTGTGAGMPPGVAAKPAGIRGEDLWPWLKDLGLLVFVVFFVAVWFGFRAAGPDGGVKGAGDGGAGSGTVEIALEEFAIKGNLKAPAGPVTLHIVNKGSVVHNLVIPALKQQTVNIDPGKDVTLQLDKVSAQSYQMFCSITGHRASGMEANLVVSAS